MRFESADQFDRAAKRAIRASGRNAGEAYREMLRDRFLCRVFSDADDRFILKGGTGLLARIPDARATKDIDFATRTAESVEDVLAALESLVAQDLGDFCTFRLTNSESTIDANGYSRLLRLRYATYIGDEEKDPILIDLSLDCATTLPPDRITPANRISIEGVSTTDYLAYPLPDQLADKLCAIMEMHPNGWPSSRMKDLVDVVAYITHARIPLAQLSHAIRSECERRGMDLPTVFEAPKAWQSSFAAFSKKSGMPASFTSFEDAVGLAAAFFDRALAFDGSENAEWDHEALKWAHITNISSKIL